MLKSSGSSYLISDPEFELGVFFPSERMNERLGKRAAVEINRLGRGGLPKGIPHCQDDSTASPLRATNRTKMKFD